MHPQSACICLLLCQCLLPTCTAGFGPFISYTVTSCGTLPWADWGIAVIQGLPHGKSITASLWWASPPTQTDRFPPNMAVLRLPVRFWKLSTVHTCVLTVGGTPNGWLHREMSWAAWCCPDGFPLSKLVPVIFITNELAIQRAAEGHHKCLCVCPVRWSLAFVSCHHSVTHLPVWRMETSQHGPEIFTLMELLSHAFLKEAALWGRDKTVILNGVYQTCNALRTSSPKCPLWGR